MGTYGVGITSNDLAQDLKSEYQAAFYYYDVETALAKIDSYVRKEGISESDEVEFCNYYYSLAHFMWKKGILTEEVRDKTVYMIDSEFGLSFWKSQDENSFKKRTKTLAEFKEMILSPQPKAKKINIDLNLESVFSVGDYIAFQLSTKDKTYLESQSDFTEDYFRAQDGKYVVIRKVQDHVSYRSKILPQVSDHWIIFQLYPEIFDSVPKIDDLNNSKWVSIENGDSRFNISGKTKYLLCESSLTAFKKRGYQLIGNSKKGILGFRNYASKSKVISLSSSSANYNADTYLIKYIKKSLSDK